MDSQMGSQIGSQIGSQTDVVSNVARAETADLIATETTGHQAAYQTLYVNSKTGSDRASGAESQPLQTITRALEVARPETVIVLAPGRYTRATGEDFPLQLKSGVTIQGTPDAGDRAVIIEGGEDFESAARNQQNAAILAADNAGLVQVTISNPNGHGLWAESASPTILDTAFVNNRQTGIYITGGSPRIQNSYFSGNQAAGLIIFGASNAHVEGNTFERTGDAIRVIDEATPKIVSNRMTDNEAGLVLIGNANPTLQDNQMAGNQRNDIVEVALSPQDITTAATLPPASLQSDSATAIPVAVPVANVSPRSRQPAASRPNVRVLSRAMNDGNPDSISRLRSRRQPTGSRPQVAPSSRESRPEPALPSYHNRLAVPNSAIPLSSRGSDIVFSAPIRVINAPSPPSQAQDLGLYYRVFVEASDPFEQDEVRAIVPDAFRTHFEGRTVMQVGAFANEAEAEERRRLLEENNLAVRVEYLR